VPLAVAAGALQRHDGQDVVFAVEGDAYVVRPVVTGATGDGIVEIRSGLAPGARYVSGNSYVIKADLEKSGASHDH
jgi:cobalt-zinc-cadmium efflux system membrane fusion protein